MEHVGDSRSITLEFSSQGKRSRYGNKFRPRECLWSGDLIKDRGLGFIPPLLLTQASGQGSGGQVTISAIR